MGTEIGQPDFIIVMEDDVRVHNRSTFWPTMWRFLNSDCSNGENSAWDILAVDTFDAHEDESYSTLNEDSIRRCEGFQIARNVKGKAFGAHLTIVKKQALPKLL